MNFSEIHVAKGFDDLNFSGKKLKFAVLIKFYP